MLNLLRDGFSEGDVRAHNVYGFVRKSRPKLHGKYIAKPKELGDSAQLNVYLIRNTPIERADESELICGNFVGVSKTWRTGMLSSRRNMRTAGEIEVSPKPELIKSMDPIATDWKKLLEALQKKKLLK